MRKSPCTTCQHHGEDLYCHGKCAAYKSWSEEAAVEREAEKAYRASHFRELSQMEWTENRRRIYR